MHLDATSWPLLPGGSTYRDWRLADGTSLDDWLASRGAAPLAERVPVLAYGSNACPSKISWLRTTHRLDGPVIVLRAECAGLAAVWAAGLRVRDGQRPATLAACPGVVETPAVWLATARQVAALDRCEGRGQRYQLTSLTTGRVRTEDGSTIDGVLAYTGHARERAPLLVDGRPVRCHDVPQSQAIALTGHPGPDGLTGRVVDGMAYTTRSPTRRAGWGT